MSLGRMVFTRTPPQADPHSCCIVPRDLAAVPCRSHSCHSGLSGDWGSPLSLLRCHRDVCLDMTPESSPGTDSEGKGTCEAAGGGRLLLGSQHRPPPASRRHPGLVCPLPTGPRGWAGSVHSPPSAASGFLSASHHSVESGELEDANSPSSCKFLKSPPLSRTWEPSRRWEDGTTISPTQTR